MRLRLSVLLLLAACGGTADEGGTPDAPVVAYDARRADASVAPLDCTTTQDHPEKLGCTGLYADWATRTLSPTVRQFKPGFELWSDGAAKTRWIELPAGTTIDVSDSNGWIFPVGTKVWKEFRLDTGNGLRPIETRLLWKRAGGWLRTTYVWSADGSEANEVRTGVMNVPGTDGYSIPATTLCLQCHGGRIDELLGFEAVSLAAPEATGLTYAELQRLALLTSSNGRHTLPASSLQIPGSTVERTALGVLHANCGVSCHNPIGAGGRFEARLEVGAGGTLGAVLDTAAVQTMVNQRSTYRPEGAPAGSIYYRLRPLDASHSTALERMGKRGLSQMPPIASAKVDSNGVAAVTAWVNAMTQANGYPPPASTGPDAGVTPDAATVVTPDAATVVTPDARVFDAPVVSAPDAAPPPDAPPPDAPPQSSCNPLPALKLTLVEEGFDQPLFVTAPPGDATRLFVVEKGGAVKVIKNGAALATPFLTVPDWSEPSPSSEGGLLGMAFDPDYAANGRFYLHYTRTPNDNVVVREFHRSAANADRADTAVVTTFVDADHGGWNHVGGMLAFGPDGLLYAAIGDRGSVPSPARDLDSQLGKILRIDVDTYPTPPSGNVAGGDPFVFDWGLRNPWRFSFDRMTGTLYIGDVGQNEWEEIDVQPSGAGPRDYGWDELEATHCYPPGTSCTAVGTPPVVEHAHDDGTGGAITGGYVYRGANIPCLRGRYVYGDYGTGRVYSFVYSGGIATAPIELTADLDPGDTLISGLASFGEDSAGELYLVMIFSGRVYRIDPQ